MKKIILMLTMLALVACEKVYQGSLNNYKIVNVVFKPAHIELIHTPRLTNWMDVPDKWTIKALYNNEVITVDFDYDPKLKTDSVYSFLILQ